MISQRNGPMMAIRHMRNAKSVEAPPNGGLITPRGRSVRSRSWFRLLLLLTAATLCCRVAAAQSAAGSGSSTETGVLLMAHGGGKDWNGKVQSVADDVNKQMPTEVAFGMADRATLQTGIDKLTARGVKQIVAVPLFISSHSSVIESTKYLLGLRLDAPKELADFAMGADMAGMKGPMPADKSAKKEIPLPVKSTVPIRMTPALDQHRIVADILSDRAAAIAKDPAHDVVILVAHGPVSDQENAQWLADMAALAKLVATHAPYARVEYVTLRDDAEAPVRDEATAGLRKVVQAGDDGGYHVLIVPLLLSYGGIENGLRQRLDGVEHTLAPQGLLPDPRIAQWVLESAQESAAGPR
jgi:sirohydrochlorin ferrochelatase